MEDLKLRQKKQLIEDRVAELREQVRFCTNEYSYHHKNNEMQIMEEQMEILNAAEQYINQLVEQITKLECTMGQAHSKCVKIDSQLAVLKGEIKFEQNSHESENEDILNGYDSNKEN